jgi:hypothetical protein
MSVHLAPVKSDAKAFAAKIDFGAIQGFQNRERLIYVIKVK